MPSPFLAAAAAFAFIAGSVRRAFDWNLDSQVPLGINPNPKRSQHAANQRAARKRRNKRKNRR